jgi:hypothetical protein
MYRLYPEAAWLFHRVYAIVDADMHPALLRALAIFDD